MKRITFSINDRSVQILFTEMYNKVVTNNFSSPHMNEIFVVNNEDPYNVRQPLSFFGLKQNQYIIELKVFPN